MRITVVLVGVLVARSAAADDVPVVLEVGGSVRQFPDTAPPPSDTLARGGGGGTTVAHGTETAGLLDFRVAVGVVGGLYVVLDNELGTLGSNNEVIETAGVIGMRTGYRGVTVASEFAGGARMRVYDSPGASPGNDGGMTSVFELRVRGEVRVSPMLAVGAAVGTSLVDRGDWMAGLYLAVHNDR
jgi:hypothetical protein